MRHPQPQGILDGEDGERNIFDHVELKRIARREFGHRFQNDRDQIDGDQQNDQPVDQDLGLREFGARQADRAVFELEPGDECRLVGFRVRAKTQSTSRGDIPHRPDVVRQEIEVAEKRRRGDLRP